MCAWTFNIRSCLPSRYILPVSRPSCLPRTVFHSQLPPATVLPSPATLVPAPPIQLPVGSQWRAWKWVSDYQFPEYLAASWTTDVRGHRLGMKVQAGSKPTAWNYSPPTSPSSFPAAVWCWRSSNFLCGHISSHISTFCQFLVLLTAWP